MEISQYFKDKVLAVGVPLGISGYQSPAERGQVFLFFQSRLSPVILLAQKIHVVNCSNFMSRNIQHAR
jgi:hypothetical protein